MQRGTRTGNTNEANSDFGHVKTMTFAARSPRMFYIRSESGLIGTAPHILRSNCSSNGSMTILLTNGTRIHLVSIVPRNLFSYWISARRLTNTLAPVPVVHVPNFSVPLPHFLWNWTYPVINYTPIFLGMNRVPDHMPLHASHFHTGLLAIQDEVENVNRGLSREVTCAHMKCIKYQPIERSTSDDDTCSICLDDFSDNQIIGSTDCQHTFHFECISQWLMQKNSLPLSRGTALAI